MHQDDAELIGRTQGGDQAAFNLIVERYQSNVYNLAARILGDRTTAEDITQETFISAYRAISRFRGGRLRAWLLRIASNHSYDWIRASRRRPQVSLDQSLLNPGFSPPSTGPSPEQEALRSELRVELQRAILTLPPDQRTTLVLIDVQGMSYEETAEATRASIGTVKSRMSRARSRVRNYLLQHGELLPDRFRQRE